MWIDDIKVTLIKQFNYKGDNIPSITYEPHSLLTNFWVSGQFASGGFFTDMEK